MCKAKLDLQQFKKDLLEHSEAVVDYYDHITVEDIDVGVDFLLTNVNDDVFCGDLVLAILGDVEAAKNIAKCLDRHIEMMYSSGRMGIYVNREEE